MDKITITLDDGTSITYDVLLLYNSITRKKQYIVYTDNKKDINGEYNYYICIFNNASKNKLIEITDDNEYNEIVKEVSKYLGDQNE